jgi:hypothetical protein
MAHEAPDRTNEHDGARRPMWSMTVTEFALRHSMSPRKVWALISAGKLKTIKLGPRTTRITEEEAAEFLRRCAEGSL